MDIEGSEIAALNGAKLTIQKHRPDLGICVYHYPEQIAEVITKVNDLDRGYKFFVRNYTGYLTETVVYACHTQRWIVNIQAKGKHKIYFSFVM